MRIRIWVLDPNTGSNTESMIMDPNTGSVIMDPNNESVIIDTGSVIIDFNSGSVIMDPWSMIWILDQRTGSVIMDPNPSIGSVMINTNTGSAIMDPWSMIRILDVSSVIMDPSIRSKDWIHDPGPVLWKNGTGSSSWIYMRYCLSPQKNSKLLFSSFFANSYLRNLILQELFTRIE